MTDTNGIYWSRGSGVYNQPQVCEPPLKQNANNARHAIWHLGRDIEMEVYPSRQGWRSGCEDEIHDGRHDRGEPTIVTICASVQPYDTDERASSRLIQLPEGERTEGTMVIHVDSHQPENVKAAELHPQLFPNGIRVLGPDTEGAEDGRENFSTIFRFRNRRWKVCSVAELFEGGDEDLDDMGAIYRCIVEEYKDRNHERDALPSDNTPVWGPS